MRHQDMSLKGFGSIKHRKIVVQFPIIYIIGLHLHIYCAKIFQTDFSCTDVI